MRKANLIANANIKNINRPNSLFYYVKEHNLNRRRIAFDQIDANLFNLIDFPQSAEEEI